MHHDHLRIHRGASGLDVSELSWALERALGPSYQAVPSDDPTDCCFTVTSCGDHFALCDAADTPLADDERAALARRLSRILGGPVLVCTGGVASGARVFHAGAALGVELGWGDPTSSEQVAIAELLDPRPMVAAASPAVLRYRRVDASLGAPGCTDRMIDAAGDDAPFAESDEAIFAAPDAPSLEVPTGEADPVAAAAGEVFVHRMVIRNAGGVGRGLAVVVAGSALERHHVELVSVRLERGGERLEAELTSIAGEPAALLATYPDLALPAEVIDFAAAALAPEALVRAGMQAMFAAQLDVVLEGLVLAAGAADLTVTVMPLEAPLRGRATETVPLVLARGLCESGIVSIDAE